MKYYIIYETKCLVNDKIYVGKHVTEDLDDGYLGSGILIQRAIEKYGRNNFSRSILRFCSSEEELNLEERKIINDDFLKREDVYNIMKGGQGGWAYARTLNPVYKSGPNNPLNGQIRSEEARQKMSESAKKRVTRDGVPFKGRTHSEETRQKMKKPKTITEALIRSRSSRKGVKMSDEARMKMSESHKRRWALIKEVNS